MGEKFKNPYEDRYEAVQTRRENPTVLPKGSAEEWLAYAQDLYQKNNKLPNQMDQIDPGRPGGGGGNPTTPTPANNDVPSYNWTYNPSGSGGSSFGFKPYQESQAVIDARNAMNAHNSNPIGAWTGGAYGAALQNAMNRIVNREKFSYDLNADALYQQYKDRYIGLGKMAMQDTMGQASALTGGYGNSYAQTAGNQAYQGYLQGLNDKVPDLYQLALDTYNNEGQELYNQYSMYQNAYDTEYGQYRDRVNDWYNEANRLSNDYYNAYSQDYGLYSDNFSRALQTAQYNASHSGSSGKSVKLDDYVPDSIKGDKGLVAATQKAMTDYLNGNISYEELNGYLDSGVMTPTEKYNLLVRNAIPASPINMGGGDVNSAMPTAPVSNYDSFVQSYDKALKIAQGGGNSTQRMEAMKAIDNELGKWYEDGRLSEAEVREILKRYGL